MALTKEKKQQVIGEVNQLLAESKLTVFAKYQGTTVKSMQSLRKEADAKQTTVKVIKNRLFKNALSADDRFKEIDGTLLSGQLIYAFSRDDEVAAAQVLATFAKNEPQIEFVGALTADGTLLEAADVKVLAELPSKEQLRAQLVSTIQAPLTGVVRIVAAGPMSLVNVLQARATSLS